MRKREKRDKPAAASPPLPQLQPLFLATIDSLQLRPPPLQLAGHHTSPSIFWTKRRERRTCRCLTTAAATTTTVPRRWCAVVTGTIRRTQEVAKKRKHDHASSSRDPVEVEMQEVEDDATILKARVLRLSPKQLAKVAHLKTLKVVGGKYFDYPVLDSFGCRREEATNYWKELAGNASEYNSSSLHAVDIRSNTHKVVRLALAINFTGRTSNLNKAYMMDIPESINMGAQVKKWLTTQSKENVICVFIGPLVTTLCHGLGIDGKLRKEKVIAKMEPIIVGDLDQAKLTRSEQIALLRAHGDTLMRHGEELSRYGEEIAKHGDEIVRQGVEIGQQRDAIERQGEVIDDLQAQFMHHFHPPSQGGYH
nr:hypothetical protein Iba_chr04fCG12030 [Ipomoea batatas]